MSHGTWQVSRVENARAFVANVLSVASVLPLIASVPSSRLYISFAIASRLYNEELHIPIPSILSMSPSSDFCKSKEVTPEKVPTDITLGQSEEPHRNFGSCREWRRSEIETFRGGLRQKSWKCQDCSDNALHRKFGPPSESRVRACPRTFDADLRRGPAIRRYCTMPRLFG